MSYATAEDLLLWFGPRELGETATPDDYPVVAADLMRLTIQGGSRTAFTNPQIAAADAALERLEAALLDAKLLMDVYLARRFTLPLASTVVTGSPLPRLCGSIARFILQDDHAGKEVTAAYERALQWLALLAEGRVVLTGGPVVQSAGGASFEAGQRYFDLDGY